jgi:positive regulator of sigma E activity
MAGERILEGVITEAAGGTVTVGLETGSEHAACGGCAAKKFCGPDKFRRRLIRLENGGDSPGRAGERVRLACLSPNPALAALVLFSPPLAGIFLGGALARSLSGGEAAFLSAVLAGFAGGLALAFFCARRFPALRSRFRLLPPSAPAGEGEGGRDRDSPT